MFARRLPALATLLAAAALVLSGCGKGGPATVSLQPTTVAASHTASRAGLSKRAQWRSFAEIVNLQPADLPGFQTAAREREESGGLGLSAKETSCLGLKKEQRPLFKAQSLSFKDSEGLNSAQVSSSVSIEGSVARAEQEARELQATIYGAASRRCLEHIFSHLISREIAKSKGEVRIHLGAGGVQVGPVALGQAAQGTEAGVGMKLACKLVIEAADGGRELRLPSSFSLDVLGVLVGRATVSLDVIAIGRTNTTRLERHLIGELAERAKAHVGLFPAVG